MNALVISGLNVVDPIVLDKSITLKSNLAGFVARTDGHKPLIKKARRSMQQLLVMRNYASPYKNTDWNTDAIFNTIDEDKLKNELTKHNVNYDSIISSTISNKLDELYQAFWYLQTNYNFAINTKIFTIDKTKYVLNKVTHNGNKITIYYKKECNTKVNEYLTSNYKYNVEDNTDIIDNKTYKLKTTICDYSKTQIKTIHKYNPKRTFILNQDINGSTNILPAGSFVDVKSLYPTQIKLSTIEDVKFSFKDSDGNDRQLTIKDSDDDNSKVSFKEDVDYDISSGSLFTYDNTDDSTADKEIIIDKEFHNMSIDYDDSMLVYTEYSYNNNTYCYITKTKIYNEHKLAVSRINNIKNNSKLVDNYQNKFLNVYTTCNKDTYNYMKDDKFMGLYSLLGVNPYIINYYIDKYLYILFSKYYSASNSTTEFSIKDHEGNSIVYNFNIIYDSFLDNDNLYKKGINKIINNDGSFIIYNNVNNIVDKYIVNNLKITYNLSNRTYIADSKDGPNNIIIPYIYSINKYISIIEYLQLSMYLPKFICILDDKYYSFLSYNINLEVLKYILNKTIKDT